MRLIPKIITFVLVIIAFGWGLAVNSRRIEPMESSSSASSTSALRSQGSSSSSGTSTSSGSGTGGRSIATLEKSSGNSISQVCGGQCQQGQICITQGTGASMTYCCKTKPSTWRSFGGIPGSEMSALSCESSEVKQITSAPVKGELSASEYTDGENTYLSQFS